MPADFYPRPPRGGRRLRRRQGPRCQLISIHALREEGDAGSSVVLSDGEKISIHALREEGDHAKLLGGIRDREFLSTPSARRATLVVFSFIAVSEISIHALREEGDMGCRKRLRQHYISIHALREEGD